MIPKKTEEWVRATGAAAVVCALLLLASAYFRPFLGAWFTILFLILYVGIAAGLRGERKRWARPLAVVVGGLGTLIALTNSLALVRFTGVDVTTIQLGLLALSNGVLLVAALRMGPLPTPAPQVAEGTAEAPPGARGWLVGVAALTGLALLALWVAYGVALRALAARIARLCFEFPWAMFFIPGVASVAYLASLVMLRPRVAKRGLAMAVWTGGIGAVLSLPALMIAKRQEDAASVVATAVWVFLFLHIALVVLALLTYYRLPRHPDDRKVLSSGLAIPFTCATVVVIAELALSPYPHPHYGARRLSREHGMAQTLWYSMPGVLADYRERCGAYPAEWSALGPPPTGEEPDCRHLGLLTSEELSGPEMYAYEFSPGRADSEGNVQSYKLGGRPTQYGMHARRSFLLREEAPGRLHWTCENRAATTDDPVEIGPGIPLRPLELVRKPPIQPPRSAGTQSSSTTRKAMPARPARTESVPAIAPPPGSPTPRLVVTEVKDSTAGGRSYKRYSLSVTNWSEFPDELFLPAPDLPPCGRNRNSSRTWLEIYNQDGRRLYGHCAMKGPAALGRFLFSVSTDRQQPERVYVTLEDRRAGHVYKSNLASTVVRGRQQERSGGGGRNHCPSVTCTYRQRGHPTEQSRDWLSGIRPPNLL